MILVGKLAHVYIVGMLVKWELLNLCSPVHFHGIMSLGWKTFATSGTHKNSPLHPHATIREFVDEFS
jgi:hypothetical protein